MIVRRVVPALLALAVFAVPSFSQQAPANPQASGPRPDVIYGDDDRLDLWQVTSPALKAMAASTVGLFQSGSVNIKDGNAELSTESYGSSYGLCQDEPFREQATGAFCSGSLVAPDVIMTAGHCIRSESACKGTKFVFGFSINAKGGATPNKVPASEVYSCAQLMGREEVGTGADWALVKLDRPVAGHTPLKVNRGGAPAKGTPLIVIGHPAGLPTKVAGGASVREHRSGYFVANLDTYGGNSGSAVFNAKTGQIEGILVRGENDFVYDSANQCRRSNVCTNEGCRGEDVTTIGVLVGKIPSAASFRMRDFSASGPSLKELKGVAGESSR